MYKLPNSVQIVFVILFLYTVFSYVAEGRCKNVFSTLRRISDLLCFAQVRYAVS